MGQAMFLYDEEFELQEYHQRDGDELHDTRIEWMLHCVYTNDWADDAATLNLTFWHLCVEFINDDAPMMLLDRAMRSMYGTTDMVLYAMHFGFHVHLMCSTSEEWVSSVEYPDCHYAAYIEYGESETDWCFGKSVNHAVAASLLQWCRDASWIQLNQGTLPIS